MYTVIGISNKYVKLMDWHNETIVIMKNTCPSNLAVGDKIIQQWVIKEKANVVDTVTTD